MDICIDAHCKRRVDETLASYTHIHTPVNNAGANMFTDASVTIQLTNRERPASKSLAGKAPQGGTPI